MNALARLAVTALVAIAGAGAVAAYRTWTFEAPAAFDPSAVTLAPAPAFDLDSAAGHLSEAVRFRTVTHQNSAEDEPGEWSRLHDWLQRTYPLTHAAARRDILDRTLLYSWTGSDPSLKPIVLMAHQDVVPVAAGTEQDWTQPPFSGAVADGAVWGRGSVDDKGSLIGIFEALEALARNGFKPRRTVIVLSGQDEEASGTGAAAAATALKARGVEAEMVLDEGLVTVADFPLLKGPVALIGIAEKGYATLKVTARTAGGHSSMPPPETGVAILARALLAITDHPDPLSMNGPGAEMIRTLAPHAALPTRVAVANEWLLGPLLLREVGKTAAGAALLHTTMAPTMLSGSPKENVLPQEASAVINYRIVPGQAPDDVMARARNAVGDIKVDLQWLGEPRAPSEVSSTQSRSWKVLAALAADGGKTPVAPGLVLGATDSRNLAPVARDIYRYQPLVLSLEQLEMIHGTNEHMTLENLRRMIEFYARLIATTSG